MNTRPTPETDALAEKLIPLAENLTASNVQEIIAQILTEILTKTIKLENERDEARFDLDFRRRLGDFQNKTLDDLRSERDEAREETIRTREFMDHGFAVAQDELAAVTAQRDRYKLACDQYSENEILCKLQTVTEQRDMLAEVLRELCIALLTDTQPDITDLLNKAGAAMAAVNYSKMEKPKP
jgi:hypothetical protein